jgi:hypothetical protein
MRPYAFRQPVASRRKVREIPKTGAAAMTRLLLAVLLAGFCGLASAQTVTVSKDTGETETMQTAAVETGPKPSDRTCLRSTGSRIVASENLRAEKDRKPQRCTNAIGRVYTAEDLDRSGHMNIADALRSLDTSIR